MRYATVALVLGTGLPAQDAPEFRWHTDLAAARAEALDQGKPLLLLFRCER